MVNVLTTRMIDRDLVGSGSRKDYEKNIDIKFNAHGMFRATKRENQLGICYFSDK